MLSISVINALWSAGMGAGGRSACGMDRGWMWDKCGVDAGWMKDKCEMDAG